MRTRRDDGRSRTRRGSAVVATLMLIVVLAGLSLAMLEFGVARLREQGRRDDELRAFYLAESALSEAVYAVRLGGTGSLGTREAPLALGDGLGWTSSVVGADGMTEVTARGLAGSGRAAVQAIVQRGGGDEIPFIAGVFSSTDFVLDNTATIDGWDPALGSYETQLALGQTGGLVTIGSNGNITLNAASTMNGDVRPGPEGTYWAAASAVLTGSVVPLVHPITFPEKPSPDVPLTQEVLLVDGNAYELVADDGEVITYKLIGGANYRFQTLEVADGRTLDIDGPAVVITDQLILGTNSRLRIDSSEGEVIFYVSGTLNLPSNADIFSKTKSANGVEFILTGDETQQAVFASNSEYYGRIYGPNAEVSIDSNFEVFGAISARSVILGANSQIHYDASLDYVAGATAGGGVTVHYWGPVAFPEKDLLVNRRDPFALLEVQKEYLTKTSDALANDVPTQ